MTRFLSIPERLRCSRGVTAICLLLCGTPAWSQATRAPEEPKPLAEPAEPVEAGSPDAFAVLLAELDAPDWHARQTATEALMIDAVIRDEQIAAALADPGISLEARHRLGNALQHRVLAGWLAELSPPDAPDSQGSLGITHPREPVDVLPQHAAPEVVVMNTLPGFPAYPRLRPGDIIVRFNGQPFPAADNPRNPPAVSEVIRGRPAGEAVSLHVIRDGQPTKIQLELASTRALELYEGANPARLHASFQKRLDRRLEELRQRAQLGTPLADAAPGPLADAPQPRHDAQPDASRQPAQTDRPTPPDAPATR